MARFYPLAFLREFLRNEAIKILLARGLKLIHAGYKHANPDDYIIRERRCPECDNDAFYLLEKEMSNGGMFGVQVCTECNWTSTALRHHDSSNKRPSKWNNLSKIYREEHPNCEECGAPTEVVHHIKPWHTNEALRYDKSNLRALCKKCHEKYHPWLKEGQNK